jgi:3',5'-cyclic AMP phosphodiesterase CpdA
VIGVEVAMVHKRRVPCVGGVLLLVAFCGLFWQADRAAAFGSGQDQEPAKAYKPATPEAGAGDTKAPVAESSLRFAVLGDTGTGDRAQYDVGAQLARSRMVFPFEFVIMLGDNMYGGERPQDFVKKFSLPYKALLDEKVPFYASLGNHDDPNQRFYEPFNMNGERYYTFKKDKLGNPGVRFFALDSNYMQKAQLDWLERELKGSDSPWKIAFFHHPLYSSGARHGSEMDLRQQLEPLFVKYGMSTVFSGHEHFYERLKPQSGIYYFTAGGSAKLRVGNIMKTPMTALGFDTDYTFMLVEITGDKMYFQTLTRSGKMIDSGDFTRPMPAPTQ